MCVCVRARARVCVCVCVFVCVCVCVAQWFRGTARNSLTKRSVTERVRVLRT